MLCSLLPDWCSTTVHCLPGGASCSSTKSDCCKGRRQHSIRGWLFTCYIMQVHYSSSSLCFGVWGPKGYLWVFSPAMSNVLLQLHLDCVKSGDASILCMYCIHAQDAVTSMLPTRTSSSYRRTSDYSKDRCQQSGWNRFYIPTVQRKMSG